MDIPSYQLDYFIEDLIKRIEASEKSCFIKLENVQKTYSFCIGNKKVEILIAVEENDRTL